MKKRQNMSRLSRRKIDSFGVKYWEMCGIRFFGSGGSELLRVLDKQREKKESKTWLTTVNTEFVMEMRRDRNFMDIINKSDIKVADGIGIIWAKEVLKRPRGVGRWLEALKVGGEILRGKKREDLISGSDLMLDLSKMAESKNQKIFLLGGWENRAEKTAKFLRSRFLNLNCGWSVGEPGMKNEEVLKEINKFEPDYLFVAYGMKSQEKWIEQNLAKLKVGVVVGVGRSFDYYSGALKRAPRWVRRMGLEWLFSLIKEPGRWKRQLALPKFIWMVLTEIP